MLAACRPAERVQLERKDGATLRSEVAQGARRDARTTARHQSVRARVGLVERRFEIESHPVVEFVVQGTDRHKTFMLRTSCHGLTKPASYADPRVRAPVQPVTARW